MLVDNYAGSSEVASFLPALTFGVAFYRHSAPNGACQREWTVGSFKSAPATHPAYAGEADFINEANLCGGILPPVRIPTTFFPRN